ncbi:MULTISPECIES: hypothetical protein [unclassified Virgibacillus]|uniref:hypothetical protein n=1 Tax=unclassified Virgibacillus TaxID=2620237 RepID=UPI0024DE36FD|nr:hypothetical protein [Virgibacillus sp. LDC-1]
MQLQINNEFMVLDNKENAIQVIYEQVNKLIEEKELVFSHLLVDGIEVYEKHEEYFNAHGDSIQLVEVIVKTKKEMLWETMQSINNYLNGAVPALKELVDASYEQFTDKTWNGIDQLAEGMQWILQFMATTKSIEQKPAHWEDVEKAITACEKSFQQLMEAIEMQDFILISDILSYEVTPALEMLAASLAVSLEDKEYLNYAN